MADKIQNIGVTSDGIKVSLTIREPVAVVDNGANSKIAMSLEERGRRHRECNRKCAQKRRDRQREENKTQVVNKERSPRVQGDVSEQTTQQQFNSVMDELVLESNNERKVKIHDKFKWTKCYDDDYPITLQFQNTSKYWMDWIMVKPSNFNSAGNGLFSCLKIMKGTTVTIYMGIEKKGLMKSVSTFLKRNIVTL